MAEPPDPFTLGDEDLSLATDLYQLTMSAAYLERRPLPRATFELFVRRLPPRRGFLVFAGLEQALGSLIRLSFGRDQIEYLRRLPPFRGVGEEFFAALAGFRFRGDVRAMPEGTIFFPGEPVMQITGDLLEAQIVETLLLSIVNFQTTIASKAARVRLAAGGRTQLAEFGSRRAHGPQAAAWAARAAYLAGFDATSNVLAGQRLGIPVVGTMAHSFVMSFDSEIEAFRAYQRVFPHHTILLVDTYDTLEGVRRAIGTARPFTAVRLDSGDLELLAHGTRALLDAAGLEEVKIFASGDMNEDKIARLTAAGAPIDAYGVGTQLATSADAPYLGGIYKLVEIERGGEAVPKFKTSAGKATFPGRKQVLRRLVEGRMVGDRVVPVEPEVSRAPDEVPLLVPLMQRGELVGAVGLEPARELLRRELARLPEPLRRLDGNEQPYPVEISSSLRELLAGATERVGG